MQLNSCLFMQNLVEDIIDLSRFEFNKFEENPTVFMIGKLIDEVADIIDLQAQSKGIKVIKALNN
eukprot:CAMPEP_0170564350 /NCGR_PEP_ID=MMETSP0211-20121228/72402_1 /TAXON_ID=311385 /ORGANISM="Pseudokeronopsis sp., Strain OXSARD2" /LENGTH=64 /DNA_ID=CAMNT_0010883693 /DNA_START=1270 /DNA_END=1464 /DNA_ORIENTATION=-